MAGLAGLTSFLCIAIPETLDQICPKTMCCGLQPANYTLLFLYRFVWLVYIYTYICVFLLNRIRVFKSYSRGSGMERVVSGIPDAKSIKDTFNNPSSLRAYLYLKPDTPGISSDMINSVNAIFLLLWLLYVRGKCIDIHVHVILTVFTVLAVNIIIYYKLCVDISVIKP